MHFVHRRLPLPPTALNRRLKPYLRVAMWYLAFGVAWVFLSDSIVDRLTRSLQSLSALQTVKGWLFVAASTFLILLLSRRAYKRQINHERERIAIYRKTIEGAHHILRNYLNQMQVITLEAENCPGFDREALEVAKLVSDEASAELGKLGGLECATEAEIDQAIYRRSGR